MERHPTERGMGIMATDEGGAPAAGLRHIGMLTLRADATAADRTAIAEGLTGLVGTVDGLVSMEVHCDAGLQEGNASLTFVAAFADEPAWQAYRGHPAHLSVVRERIAPVLEDKAFVQARADGTRTAAV